MKPTYRIAVFIMSIVAGSVMAGAIKQWSSHETLTAADLNANFTHIHNLMVGGHGGRLVDADVSASANISSSKLTAHHLIPVAWANLLAVCNASPCVVAEAQGVSGVVRTAAGRYTVTLSAARANTTYTVLVSAYYNGPGVGSGRICTFQGITSTTVFLVDCTNETFAHADSAFGFVIYDND